MFKRIIKKVAVLLSLTFTVGFSGNIVKAQSNNEKAVKLTKAALEQSTFYNYNMAYIEIMNMVDVVEKFTLLAQLSSTADKIWTPEVKKAVEMLSKLCELKDGRTYDETESYLRSLSEANIDKLTQAYFLGELTGWGRRFVFTKEYSLAVESVIRLWKVTEFSPGDFNEKLFADAKSAIDKVENMHSKQYLSEQFKEAKEKYESGLKQESLTESEKQLAILINEYRKSLNLKPLTISKSLTKVARAHVNDSNNNQPEKGIDIRGIKGNLHSWSDKGPWRPVVYTSDHAYAELMWSKPSELTEYKGNGFEISVYFSGSITPSRALDAWKSSPGHNNVIIGEGYWSKLTTMGIGINGNYSHVWFGIEEDPSGYYSLE